MNCHYTSHNLLWYTPLRLLGVIDDWSSDTTIHSYTVKCQFTYIHKINVLISKKKHKELVNPTTNPFSSRETAHFLPSPRCPTARHASMYASLIVDIKQLICHRIAVSVGWVSIIYKPNRPLRSLGSSQLEIPRVHTKQGESAFSYYAARSWNQLPEEIKCPKTLATFKSRLKTHLFSCAFVKWALCYVRTDCIILGIIIFYLTVLNFILNQFVTNVSAEWTCLKVSSWWYEKSV